MLPQSLADLRAGKGVFTLHHGYIVNIRDNSDRMREHQEMRPSMQASQA